MEGKYSFKSPHPSFPLLQRSQMPFTTYSASSNSNQLGKATAFPLTDDQIQDALKDNPSGQGGELTPLILIRKV